jgi:AcrR family transcriptional regulator
MRSNSEPKSTSAARGRPRSLEARSAILQAVHDLVSKGGYNAASIEAVAARSGVAKTTIYRWWPNRASLVLELLVETANAVAPPPAGSDPMRALRTELLLVAEASEGLAGHLLSALLGEAECDPEVRDALQQRIFTPRRHATAKVIRQAQEAGEIRKDVAPLMAGELLYGPLFYKKYVRQEHVTAAFVKEVFKQVMAGLRPARAPRK